MRVGQSDDYRLFDCIARFERCSELVEQRMLLLLIESLTHQLVCRGNGQRGHLAAQVCASVLWEASMQKALESGVTRFVEPGPGKVLAGLMGKIDRSAAVRSAATPEDVARA